MNCCRSRARSHSALSTPQTGSPCPCRSLAGGKLAGAKPASRSADMMLVQVMLGSSYCCGGWKACPDRLRSQDTCACSRRGWKSIRDLKRWLNLLWAAGMAVEVNKAEEQCMCSVLYTAAFPAVRWPQCSAAATQPAVRGHTHCLCPCATLMICQRADQPARPTRLVK